MTRMSPTGPTRAGCPTGPRCWTTRRSDRSLPDRRPPGRGGPGRPGRRRRWIPRWLKWSAVLLVIGLIFRRAIASVVLMALSGMLHLVGIHVHLPSIKFAWPWQTISAGTASNIEVGPWVLQKIEGISRPALGQVNFNFVFTHKVSKSIGPWPCWYASTFYVSGHAAATVDLNPGPSWWRPKTGRLTSSASSAARRAASPAMSR